MNLEDVAKKMLNENLLISIDTKEAIEIAKKYMTLPKEDRSLVQGAIGMLRLKNEITKGGESA